MRAGAFALRRAGKGWRMRYRVRVALEPTDEVRATLAALKISVEGSTGTGGSLIALVDAHGEAHAERAVREALARWPGVRLESLGRAR